jgi:hypothetical protein
LLLTGETLSCCRINESISASLRALVTGSDHHEEAADESGDPHSHCHGHAQNALPEHGAPIDAGSAYVPFGSCISQYSLQAKPMVAGEFAFSLAILSTQVPILAFEGVAPFMPERPRPQNKAGPPVYLITLRLLV